MTYTLTDEQIRGLMSDWSQCYSPGSEEGLFKVIKNGQQALRLQTIIQNKIEQFTQMIDLVKKIPVEDFTLSDHIGVSAITDVRNLLQFMVNESNE